MPTLQQTRTLDIGKDLDGCSHDFVNGLRTWIHRSTGRPLATMPDALTWDFAVEQWGMTTDEWLGHYRDGVEAGFIFSFGDPLPGAVEAVQRLAEQGHRLHVVTARGITGQESIVEGITRDWLDRHNLPYASITIASDKPAVAAQLGLDRFDCFIEDAGHNYDLLDAGGHNPWLITRPWNTYHPGRRVEDWDGFCEVVTELAAA